MKRVISMLLAVLMVMSLVACGNGGGASSSGGKTPSGNTSSTPSGSGSGAASSTTEPEPPTKLTIGMPESASVKDYHDNYFTKYIEEKLNLELDFVFFPSNSNAADRDTKLATMVAGGEKLPDILFNMNLAAGTRDIYGNDGYIMDMAPYFDDPNWEIAKEYDWHNKVKNLVGEDGWKSVMYDYRTAEGKMFYFPRCAPSINDNTMNQVFINQTWLDKLGLDMPTNTQELLEVLRAFKTKDPNGNGKADELPILGSYDTAGSYCADVVSWLLNSWIFVSDNYMFNVTDDGKVYMPYDQPEYREGMRYIRTLVAEGLLSEMFWTIKKNNELKPLWAPAEGPTIVGVWAGWISYFPNTTRALFEYEVLPPLEGAYNPTRAKTGNSNYMITTDCTEDRFDAACRFMMSFSDMEVSRVFAHGEEGVHWRETLDINGLPTIEILDDSSPHNRSWALIAPNVSWSGAGSPWSVGTLPREPKNLEEEIDDKRLQLFSDMVAANKQYSIDHNPKNIFFYTAYTAEEAEENGTIIKDLKSWMKQQRGLFATGQLDINDDKVWKEYCDELNARGMQTVIKNTQAAWDRRVANTK